MLLAPLEALLNRNIAASGAARALCTRLAGKTLAVQFLAAHDYTLLGLYFASDGERVSIVTQPKGELSATLSGTPLAFFGMLGPQAETALRSGGVRIEGDAEAAQAFRDLLKAARPDFEEELARLVGDVAAHQLGRLAHCAATFGKRVVDTFAQNVSEYLQEESRDLATRIEVDEFIAAVDRLREDVDRVEARLALLERRVPLI